MPLPENFVMQMCNAELYRTAIDAALLEIRQGRQHGLIGTRWDAIADSLEAAQRGLDDLIEEWRPHAPPPFGFGPPGTAGA